MISILADLMEPKSFVDFAWLFGTILIFHYVWMWQEKHCFPMMNEKTHPKKCPWWSLFNSSMIGILLYLLWTVACIGLDSLFINN